MCTTTTRSFAAICTPFRGAGVGTLLAAIVFGTPVACDFPAEADRSGSTTPDAATRERAEPADIVSLDPGATHFLLKLGAADRLVAIGGPASHIDAVAALPRVEWDEALAIRPRWLFTPSQPSAMVDASHRPPRGTRLVEFAPHDLEDLFALSRTVGRELVGHERATAFEVGITRPLSLVAAESPATGRPRAVAIVDDDPLMIAGGHSFASDLLEIAGAESATHGRDEHRIPADATSLRALAPDVLVLMLTESSRIERARGWLPAEIPVFAFPDPTDRFWAEESPAATARRLREALLVATAASRRTTIR